MQSLFSPGNIKRRCYESPAGGMFPVRAAIGQSRRRGLRFWLSAGGSCAPLATMPTIIFFTVTAFAARILLITAAPVLCITATRRRHACSFDYLAQLRYRLPLCPANDVELTLTMGGPCALACGFHPAFAFGVDHATRVQFRSALLRPEENHLSTGKTLPKPCNFGVKQFGVTSLAGHDGVIPAGAGRAGTSNGP
ncbi:hypothetical protein LNP05_29550 [Klebsiella pneumoniae subsp. pneumoniae]|nr:hypothetical protein [Klebsiella pneumoniae subsp. pneumoniae]